MNWDDDEDDNGGDPQLMAPPTTAIEKRKLRSNKTSGKNDSDEETNKSKRNKTTDNEMHNGNKMADLSKTKRDHSLNQATGAIAKTTGKTARANKDKIDGQYIDNWTKNTIYTTFIIEKKKKDGNGTEKEYNQKEKYPHPMEVAKMLQNIGVKNYREMKSVGRGRFQITYDKPREAEQLINSKLLTDEFGYTVFVPGRFKESIGVVRNVPPTLNEDEILNNISSGNIQIQKVERINRKVADNKFTPTYSIKIYAKGQHLPDSIMIYGIPARCEPYIFPLKVCNKCWRFGHVERFCKSQNPRCNNCGNEHTEKECQNETTTCVNCKGEHKANDKECPERRRQDKIRVDMAVNKTSFFEATKKYPRNNISTVQYRLESEKQFPSLPEIENETLSKNFAQPRKDKKKNIQQKYTFPQAEIIPEPQHTFEENPHRTSEIERITQHIKEEIIKQLNLKNIVDKIKAIQNNISQNTQKTDTIEQDLLIINISNELNAIINPEINI